MRPQFTIQEFSGKHNKNLKDTFNRLEKSGSWKKQRIIVIIPTDEAMPAKAALSIWNLAFPPNNGVLRILAQGMEVGAAYSGAIENIQGHPDLKEWEFFLTIEHDNMPPPDGVVKLIEDMEAHPEYSAIGGLYYTKGEGGCPQIWGDPLDMPLNFRPRLPDVNGGLLECCGTGMGFTLFRSSIFKDKKLPKPWFKTVAGKEGVGTQDLQFWTNARKLGYRCAIDCSIRVGHYDLDTDIIW